MSIRRERVLFTILAAVAFVYVLLRAALVPVVHDEARSFQRFVLTGDFLPFRAAWDAGNHLLASALARVSYVALGPGLLPLRIWSVLAFAVYAAYAWKIGRSIGSSTIRWSLWAALLFTPFVIEFFSLFRGYGLALAFLLMAIHHVAQFAASGSTRALLIALCAMALATFNSLSLLIMWCALVGGVLLLIVFGRKEWRVMLAQAATLIVFGMLPLGFAAYYSVKLSQTGALYFGSELGLVHGTLASLADFVIGAKPSWLLWMLVILVGLVVALSASRVSRTRDIPSLIAFACAFLFLADLCGRVVLGQGFGVLYPTDRTAMQLVLLFLILVASAIDHYASRWAMARYGSIALLAFPLRIVLTANIDHTSYWPEQAIPDKVFALAEEKQRLQDRPLLIAGYHQNPAAWAYGNFLRDNGMNFMDVTGFPQPTCDLMLIDTEFFTAPAGFRTLYKAPPHQSSLLEREQSINTTVVRDTTWALGRVGEFTELWAPQPEEVRGREWLIEIDVTITSPADPLIAKLVVEVTDAQGEHLHYDIVSLEDQRPSWNGDKLHVLRRLPVLDANAHRVVVYLWNQRGAIIDLGHIHLTVHEVRP